MLGIGARFGTFGTGKHNFGYVPDPPEPEETECTDEYVEGSCECCDHYEQCLEVWRNDEGLTVIELIISIFVIGIVVFWAIVLITYGSKPVSEMPTWLYFLLSD